MTDKKKKKIPKAITRHAPGYAGHVKIAIKGFLDIPRNLNIKKNYSENLVKFFCFCTKFSTCSSK